MTKVPITISVDDEHLSQVPAVAAALREKGVTVEKELEASGVIIGSVDTADLAEIEDVAGVAFVEQERSFDIGPPERDVQ